MARLARTLAFVSLLAASRLLVAGDPAPVGRFHSQLVPAQGYEVAFEIQVDSKGGALSASLWNGATRAPFTSAEWNGEALVLRLAHFDATITARPSGTGLVGTYRRVTAGGPVEVPFRASRERPASPKPAGGRRITGDWAVEIGEGAAKETLSGLFTQSGGAVTGTMRSTTGDYGPLHGTFDGKSLVLSVFDGVHVYRFDGTLREDGTLDGDFRSRTSPPVPWSARRVAKGEEEKVLPDLFTLVSPVDREAPFRFSFADADGKVVSDETFAGKPMIVTLMGTWCPNCNDEAPVIQDLFARLGPKGLQVVALAFEYTDDEARSRQQMKRFQERHALTYPVLLAGTTKNAPTGAVMKQLKGWKGYPTTLFLDKRHRIVKVHSGFDGPATGAYFKKLKGELEETAKKLLE